MLAQLSDIASEQGLPARLLTFEPHPVELLATDRAPARLTRFREKVAVLTEQPLDGVVAAHFHRRLADMAPQDFIDQVLVGRLGVRHLLVGDDFRFGRGGEGDFATLMAAAGSGRFGLSRMDTQRDGGERISSTRVRQCLAAGDLDTAATLLGRPYSVCARVNHGQRLGRTIGFPTANLPLRRRVSPVSGVYAVSVRRASGTVLQGVANVGRRPTVNGSGERLEVHLFDFEGDLYGEALEVCFLAHLRPEQRFDGLDALKAQIARDAEAARAIHAATGAG